jgi:hypothetical protein
MPCRDPQGRRNAVTGGARGVALGGVPRGGCQKGEHPVQTVISSRLSVMSLFVLLWIPIATSSTLRPQPSEASPVLAALGGAVSNIVVIDDHAYVGVGTHVLVLDISDRAHPREAGVSADLPAPIRHLAAAGGRLFAANSFVTTFDLTDPNHPDILGMIQAWACRIAANDAYVYPLGGCGGYTREDVVDMRDPLHPIFLQPLPNPHPHGDLVVAGEVGFAISGTELLWLDLSDPAVPRAAGEVDTTQGLARLALEAPLLYIAVTDGRLLVYDVGAGAPALVGSCAAGGRTYAVAARGQTAYLVTSSALRIVDATTPSDIKRRGTVGIDGARDVTLLGDYAYVTGADGITVVDVTDPDRPEITAAMPMLGVADDVALLGDSAFVATGDGGVAIVDLARPSEPRLTSRQHLTFPAERIDLEPGRAYVAGPMEQGSGSGAVMGLAIVDVSLEASPTLRSLIAVPGSPNDLAVADGVVYVAGGRTGVTAFDATDPTHPRTIAGSGVSTDAAEEVLATAGLLYLVEAPEQSVDEPATNRLRLFDTTSQLRQLGQLTFDSQADSRGMVLVGHHLFLPGSPRPIRRGLGAEYPEDILDVDVTYPDRPRAAGFVPLGAYPKDIEFVGDTAYIVSGRYARRFEGQAGESLIMLHGLADPDGPPTQRTVDLPAVPRSLAITGEHAIVALGEAGLFVIDIRPMVVTPTGVPTPAATGRATQTAGPATTAVTATATASAAPTGASPAPPWLCLLPLARR